MALLESALRARKLDQTLTTARLPGKGDENVAPTTMAGLDAGLEGGLPRGQLSEVVGARSSGRTTLLLQMLAAATRRGDIAAVVDTFDQLDVSSGMSAGIALDRLLWVRGHAISRSQTVTLGSRSGPSSPGPEALVDRLIERALKAFHLVLQSGGFGMAALDLADAPLAALNRLPFMTWLRLQRAVEGTEIACVLIVPRPLARSAGGVTLSLDGRTQWVGVSERSRRLIGMDVTARVVSPRRRVDGAVTIHATAQGIPMLAQSETQSEVVSAFRRTSHGPAEAGHYGNAIGSARRSPR